MTKAQAVLVLACSLSFVAASQLLFKAGFMRLSGSEIGQLSLLDYVRRGAADPRLWAGGILLVGGMICWYAAMTRLPLSLMMPLAAIIAPVVAIGAWVFFDEPLTVMKVAAICMIAVGAMWLGWLNS